MSLKLATAEDQRGRAKCRVQVLQGLCKDDAPWRLSQYGDSSPDVLCCETAQSLHTRSPKPRCAFKKRKTRTALESWDLELVSLLSHVILGPNHFGDSKILVYMSKQ